MYALCTNEAEVAKDAMNAENLILREQLGDRKYDTQTLEKENQE